MVSHYSTTYIFFFILLGTFLGIEILSKKYTFKKVVSLTMVILSFALVFFWYSQVTETAFNVGVGFVEEMFSNLNRFFIEESRTGTFMQLAGQELRYPILSRVSLAFTWGTFIFIGIGILTMIMSYKEMILISNVKHKKPDFLKTKFEMVYLIIVLMCAGLLVIMVALPYISIGYDIWRLYSLVLIILSVCFVIGGITLSHFLSKERTCAKKETLFASKSVGRENGSQVRAYLIILLILIPYSLFVTGAIHQLFGARDTIILNSEGEVYDRCYVHDQESYGAKWLMTNSEKNSRIYTTDFEGVHRLMSQGKISLGPIDWCSFSRHKKIEGYIYLYYNNVINGKLEVERKACNMSEYSDTFVGMSRIYSNGGSETWK
jgi:uncharacterized membrane protein